MPTAKVTPAVRMPMIFGVRSSSLLVPNMMASAPSERQEGAEAQDPVVVGESFHEMPLLLFQLTLRMTRTMAPTAAAPKSSAPYWLTLPDWTGWSP